jgi:tetratricopeptide (TPR) repeat protein
MAVTPDPRTFLTREDFGRGLTDLRRRVGLSVRDAAKALDIPTSTVGGYFSGSHLPYAHAGELIARILQVCGVSDPVELEQWREAFLRVSDATGQLPLADDDDTVAEVRASPAGSTAGGDRGNGGTLANGIGGHSGDYRPPGPLVSIRPPVERLAREPVLRGRAQLLKELIRAAARSGPASQHAPAAERGCVHVLHGLGGSGKSTLALAVAQCAQSRGIQAWWVSADEAAGVDQGMRSLAIELGVSPQRLVHGSAIDLCWHVLSRYRRPWLLILDNVDDPRTDLSCGNSPVCDGTGWLRPITGERGLVIVTSRDGDSGTWGPPGTWITTRRVGLLTPADSSLVLRELAGEDAGPEASALALAQRLGGLPLALRHAGLYIAEARRMPHSLTAGDECGTFDAYLTAMDHAAGTMPGTRTAPNTLTGQRVRGLIGQTWELSLDLLDRRGMPECRPLLRLLACLQHAPIAYGLLRPDILARSPFFQGVDQRRLWELVQALIGLGLADLQGDPAARDPAMADSLVLHPLVRFVSRRSPEVQRDISGYAALLTSLLASAADGLDPRDPVSWPRWRAVADHCLAALDLLSDAPGGDSSEVPGDILEPPLLSARYLRAAGRLADASRLVMNALDRGRQLLPDTHQALLALRHDLARVWYGLGKWARAERMLTEVTAARKCVLGAEHPDTLTSMHYLGRVLRDRGRIAEAEAMLTDTLRVRRKVLGDLAPDTLTTLNNLAELRSAQGRHAEAERMLRHVLAARRELLGDRYPATLVTRYYLASVHRDDGQPPDEVGLRVLVEDCHQTLGPMHPRSLAAQRLLALTLGDLGRQPEAWSLLSDVFARQTELLGPRHPATLVTRKALDEAAAAADNLPDS